MKIIHFLIIVPILLHCSFISLYLTSSPQDNTYSFLFDTTILHVNTLSSCHIYSVWTCPILNRSTYIRPSPSREWGRTPCTWPVTPWSGQWMRWSSSSGPQTVPISPDSAKNRYELALNTHACTSIKGYSIKGDLKRWNDTYF